MCSCVVSLQKHDIWSDQNFYLANATSLGGLWDHVFFLFDRFLTVFRAGQIDKGGLPCYKKNCCVMKGDCCVLWITWQEPYHFCSKNFVANTVQLFTRGPDSFCGAWAGFVHLQFRTRYCGHTLSRLAEIRHNMTKQSKFPTTRRKEFWTVGIQF